MSNRTPQWKRVLEFIDRFGSITAWEAMKELGIMRLAARIFDIRSRHGIPIEMETVHTVNAFGEQIHYSRYRRAA